MNAVIDLGSELLLDRSEVSDPYMRLLAAVMGQTLAVGSPWVALDKQSGAYPSPSRLRSGPAPRPGGFVHRRRLHGVTF